MPRVTDLYAQRRRSAIIAAARRLRARGGFHSTTMEDVTVEAGISSSEYDFWFPRSCCRPGSGMFADRCSYRC